ncbi:MAG TPA: 2-oxoacid:ferredoxin oxidoreductase subunit gamma [Lentisphaeria bacterium]|nr:MAG: 2-oxoglutarate ferredoxin oxidoreductase subunit gamma [Lentisphaerae bacterium GWF2_38_69]HBM16875.1 2-oxoacid:ferredoxin oxidoreductase subunit gamma [Lentisphaeria bacterium]
MEKHKIVFSGSGGQGVITAAVILAEAAVIYENLHAVQTQSYGPEARGGATRSDVVISDTQINYPKVTHPNLLVCLTQESYNKYSNIVLPGGLIITDPRHVVPNVNSDSIIKELPLYDTVMEKLGNQIVLNVCMLGAVIKILPVLKPESVLKAVIDRVNPKFKDLNTKAFQLGYDMVKK